MAEAFNQSASSMERPVDCIRQPARIITQQEYEELLSRPGFTYAHKIVLDKKIESGEWIIEEDESNLSNLVDTLIKIRKQSDRIETKIKSLNTSPHLIKPPRSTENRTGTVLLSGKGNNNFVRNNKTGISSERMSSPESLTTCRQQA